MREVQLWAFERPDGHFGELMCDAPVVLDRTLMNIPAYLDQVLDSHIVQQLARFEYH